MTTTNRDLFAKHLALGIWIETGSGFGRLIDIALELGFPDIRSVEAEESRYKYCVERYKEHPNVKLFLGESRYLLEKMMEDLKAPSLIWSDAHPSGDGSYGQDFEMNVLHSQTSIIQAELEVIRAHPVSGHVVLVDDYEPWVKPYAMTLWPEARFTLHDTDEGAKKVVEIQT